MKIKRFGGVGFINLTYAQVILEDARANKTLYAILSEQKRRKKNKDNGYRPNDTLTLTKSY
jgi:hypothetical protein